MIAFSLPMDYSKALFLLLPPTMRICFDQEIFKEPQASKKAGAPAKIVAD